MAHQDNKTVPPIYKDIILVHATAADYPTIQNMARFYVYDMSEFFPDWAIPEDGLYECIDFKKYFDAKDTFPFLIRKEKELVGFVIVDKKGSTPDIEFNMTQFFILRKFKGQGIGRSVAHQCFDQFTGIWEVMVLPGNKGAYQFWKCSIQKYTDGNFTEYTKQVAHLENCEKNIFRFESTLSK